ncbi:MAG: hypothetical protein MZV49_00580 [Rhodopseudomonas palustris]|nr:hypothetical protein [Rhodopseudomonas palustris]
MDDEELQGILLRAQEIATLCPGRRVRYRPDGQRLGAGNGRGRGGSRGSAVFARQSLRPIRWVLAVPNDSPIRTVRGPGRQAHRHRGRASDPAVSREKRGVHAEVEFSWGATEVKAPTPGGRHRRGDGDGRLASGPTACGSWTTLVVSTTRLIANKESWKDPWKREKTENLVTAAPGRHRRRAQGRHQDERGDGPAGRRW